MWELQPHNTELQFRFPFAIGLRCVSFMVFSSLSRLSSSKPVFIFLVFFFIFFFLAFYLADEIIFIVCAFCICCLYIYFSFSLTNVQLTLDWRTINTINGSGRFLKLNSPQFLGFIFGSGVLVIIRRHAKISY